VVAGLQAAELQVGAGAWPEGGDLVIGQTRVRLRSARTVPTPAPRPAAGPAAGPGAARAAQAAAAACGTPPPGLGRGVAALEHGDARAGVTLLAGRGDGLTPAGDDVLAGYAGWCAAAGEPVALAELAADRCSPLGLAYLACAERGELPAPAAGVVSAIRAGDAEQARRRTRVLCRWGHSSGAALMWGLSAGRRATLRRPAPVDDP
jgi:hypothetical protein